MKNLKVFPLLFSILCAIGLTACHKKKADNYFSTYFPLQVGNTWVYEESYYFPDTSKTPHQVSRVTCKILKDTTIEDDQLAFIVEQTYVHAADNISISRFLQYEVDGELRERFLNFTGKFYTIQAKLDMQEGMEWILNPTATGQDFPNRIVREDFPNYEFKNFTTQTFLLANGNPNLRQDGQYGEYEEIHFAPRIGILKSAHYTNYYGSSKRIRTLKDYYVQ